MTISMPNSTGYFGVMQWANTQLNGSMAWGILLIIFSVVVFGSMRYGAPLSKALLAAASGCMVIAFALVGMQVMLARDLLIMLFLLMFAFIYDYHA
jgi:hypothetical protein